MTPLHGPQVRVLAALILAMGVTSLAYGSTPSAEPNATRQGSPETEEIKRLDAWPEVDKGRVKAEVGRLRKNRVPEMGEQAYAALIEMGAGAAPALLNKYGKEKAPDAVERMREVLEKITGAQHTRLLAEYFDHKDAPTRIWALKRVASFPDPGTRAAAEAAFKAADGRKRGRDPKEVFAAAVSCAASGSFDGFDVVCKDAEIHWKANGPLIHTALTALRGAEATEKVKPLLESSSRKRKVAGLRLLAACGERKTAVALVRPLLDSEDNNLRVGAINALRGIVDGQPPLSRLPVFEAIERANKWKSRL